MTEEFDELLARAAAELRRPVTLRADFEDRVMSAVRHPAPGILSRAVSWLVTPRPVRIPPLAGLAAAAAIVLGVIAVTLPRHPAGSAASALAAAESANGARLVQFVLVAPEAEHVNLVGDFNDWRRDATPLTPTASGGVWTVAVPLSPGQHQYAFVVDGTQWIADPTAPREIGDDFGAPSSLITVTPAGRS